MTFSSFYFFRKRCKQRYASPSKNCQIREVAATQHDLGSYVATVQKLFAMDRVIRTALAYDDSVSNSKVGAWLNMPTAGRWAMGADENVWGGTRGQPASGEGGAEPWRHATRERRHRATCSNVGFNPTAPAATQHQQQQQQQQLSQRQRSSQERRGRGSATGEWTMWQALKDTADDAATVSSAMLSVVQNTAKGGLAGVAVDDSDESGDPSTWTDEQLRAYLRAAPGASTALDRLPRDMLIRWACRSMGRRAPEANTSVIDQAALAAKEEAARAARHEAAKADLAAERALEVAAAEDGDMALFAAHASREATRRQRTHTPLASPARASPASASASAAPPPAEQTYAGGSVEGLSHYVDDLFWPDDDDMFGAIAAEAAASAGGGGGSSSEVKRIGHRKASASTSMSASQQQQHRQHHHQHRHRDVDDGGAPSSRPSSHTATPVSSSRHHGSSHGGGHHHHHQHRSDEPAAASASATATSHARRKPSDATAKERRRSSAASKRSKAPPRQPTEQKSDAADELLDMLTHEAPPPPPPPPPVVEPVKRSRVEVWSDGKAFHALCSSLGDLGGMRFSMAASLVKRDAKPPELKKAYAKAQQQLHADHLKGLPSEQQSDAREALALLGAAYKAEMRKYGFK